MFRLRYIINFRVNPRSLSITRLPSFPPLKKKEPPVLAPLLLSASVCDVGDYVQLTCIASRGATPIQFEWWLGGRQVHDDGDDDVTQATVGEHTSLLLMQRVGEGQAGNYSCRARNQVGVAERRASLTVNGNQLHLSRF